jgi:hypothetical protein
MGVQVVPHQDHLLGLGMIDLEQFSDLFGQVDGRFGGADIQPPKGSVSMKLTAVPKRSYS